MTKIAEKHPAAIAATKCAVRNNELLKSDAMPTNENAVTIASVTGLSQHSIVGYSISHEDMAKTMVNGNPMI